jgi:hypothetical protein
VRQLFHWTRFTKVSVGIVIVPIMLITCGKIGNLRNYDGERIGSSVFTHGYDEPKQRRRQLAVDAEMPSPKRIFWRGVNEITKKHADKPLVIVSISSHDSAMSIVNGSGTMLRDISLNALPEAAPDLPMVKIRMNDL